MNADSTSDQSQAELDPPYLTVEISRAGGEWDAAAEEIVLRMAQAAFEQERKFPQRN